MVRIESRATHSTRQMQARMNDTYSGEGLLQIYFGQPEIPFGMQGVPNDARLLCGPCEQREHAHQHTVVAQQRFLGASIEPALHLLPGWRHDIVRLSLFRAA